MYRPVAAEASMMYFMLLKLSSVDFMYQYSLDSFTRYAYMIISSECKIINLHGANTFGPAPR